MIKETCVDSLHPKFYLNLKKTKIKNLIFFWKGKKNVKNEKVTSTTLLTFIYISKSKGKIYNFNGNLLYH